MKRQRLIKISLLVLIFFFTCVCSTSKETARLLNEKAYTNYAKVFMEYRIVRIIERAEEMDTVEPKNNIVLIIGEIKTKKAIKIVSEINQIERDPDFQAIIIYLDSGGGGCSQGFAICRTIANCQKEVKIICRRAYSMAASILVSGTKGQRFVLTSDQSTVLIHRGYSEKDHLSRMIVSTLILGNKLECDLLIKNTKLTSEQITKAVNKSTSYTAEQSVEFGFADKVIPYK